MKREWHTPEMKVTQVDLSRMGDVTKMSDAELKIQLEKAGYAFQKTYQASKDYIYRKVADSDVLISVGSNIANFNGYIEINQTAVELWKKLQEPCRLSELEQVLEEKYGITHEEAVADVIDFINELREHEMVVIQ